MKDIIKIALGIAGGLILVSFIWLTITAIIAKSAIEQMNKINQDAVVQMQKIARDATQKQQDQATAKATAQRNAIAQAQIDQQEIIDLRIEKNKAWKSFYTKASECENPPTINAMGECANIEIRAKRKFEEQWSASHTMNVALPSKFEPYALTGSIKKVPQ